MTMQRQPPRFATWLLSRLGTGCLDADALAGDLIEQYRAGRSRDWYWRQVVGSIAIGTVREFRLHPWLAARGVVVGWAVVLSVFHFLGDPIANWIAGYVWGWSRSEAYAGHQPWWPFWIAAAVVSYAGFALSAWVVARAQRRTRMSALSTYIASIWLAFLGAVFFIEVVMAGQPVPVPHTLFYVVSLSLPHLFRSGFVLVPIVIVLAGLPGMPRRAGSPQPS